MRVGDMNLCVIKRKRILVKKHKDGKDKNFVP